MSVNSWKLEKGLCRCCHAEGAFKSLSEPSYTLGQVEVFSDMLRQCLDIEVQPVEGVYSETTYTICDACAHRLRDASNFKQQVLQCEERFRDMYKNVKALGDIQVKQETEICAIEYQMKIEQSDDDDDAGMDFGQDGDGDGDEDDNKTVLQLLLEGKKEKGKGKAKPKPKPKPKAKKAVPKPAQAAKPKPAKSKKVEKKEDDTPKKDDEFTITIAANGTKDFNCKTCGKRFKNRPNFNQHYNFVHLKKRPLFRKCSKCDEKYTSDTKSAHMESAHGIPSPKCNICDRKFNHPSRVLEHQRFYHMGEKLHACPDCDLRFGRRSHLNIHMRKHSLARPYVCEFCDKSFKWKKSHLTHLMIHLNVKNHVCLVCSEKFVQHSSLSYHMKTRHPELNA